MPKPKVSIIIPVNNLENYIRKSLNSVIKQTLNDIEIICVDDGSTDNSLKIIKDFAKKDSRIIVIEEKEAKGQSLARNIGIKKAKGEYIGFVDGDDWVDSHMFEKMYENAKSFDSDITMCSSKIFDEHKQAIAEDNNYYNLSVFDETFDNKTFSHIDVPELMFDINVAVWNKIYKRVFLQRSKVKFEEGYIYEDLPFFYETYLKAKKVSLVRDFLYFYRINRLGSTMSNIKRKILDRIDMVGLTYNMFKFLPYYEEIKIKIIDWVIGDLFHRYTLVNPKYKKEFFFKMKKAFLNLDISNIDEKALENIYYYKEFLFVKKEDYEESNKRFFGDYIIFKKEKQELVSQYKEEIYKQSQKYDRKIEIEKNNFENEFSLIKTKNEKECESKLNYQKKWYEQDINLKLNEQKEWLRNELNNLKQTHTEEISGQKTVYEDRLISQKKIFEADLSLLKDWYENEMIFRLNAQKESLNSETNKFLNQKKEYYENQLVNKLNAQKESLNNEANGILNQKKEYYENELEEKLKAQKESLNNEANEILNQKKEYYENEIKIKLDQQAQLYENDLSNKLNEKRKECDVELWNLKNQLQSEFEERYNNQKKWFENEIKNQLSQQSNYHEEDVKRQLSQQASYFEEEIKNQLSQQSIYFEEEIKNQLSQQSNYHEEEIKNQLSQQANYHEEEIKKQLLQQSNYHDEEIKNQLSQQSNYHEEEIKNQLSQQSNYYEEEIKNHLESQKNWFESEIDRRIAEVDDWHNKNLEEHLVNQKSFFENQIEELNDKYNDEIKEQKGFFENQIEEINNNYNDEIRNQKEKSLAELELQINRQRENSDNELYNQQKQYSQEIESQKDCYEKEIDQVRFVLKGVKKIKNLFTQDKIEPPNKKPKVSVILPVYNVDKYLRQALDSLLNQTLKDIEIICVNDGSTDNCANILDEYQSKDSRIKVIHKQNAGTGAARNDGLKLATGECIGFVDPDDWVKENMFERLYSLMKERNVDIVMCTPGGFDEQNQVEADFPYFVDANFKKELDNKIFSWKDISPFSYPMCVWNKLYKKELFDKNNIDFAEGLDFEDHKVIFKSLLTAEKIFFIREKLYIYRFNRVGSILSDNDNRLIDHFKIFDIVENILNETNTMKELRNDFLTYKIHNILYYYGMIKEEHKQNYYYKMLDSIRETNLTDEEAQVLYKNYPELENIIKDIDS